MWYRPQVHNTRAVLDIVSKIYVAWAINRAQVSHNNWCLTGAEELSVEIRLWLASYNLTDLVVAMILTLA